MKPLTLEETRLKEEMKERCFAKGQYIDEKAKEKFDMLCHLEDFEVQYWELLKENQELKKQLEQYQEEVCILDMKTDENIKLQNNWNELKEIVNDTFYKLNGILDRDLLEKQMYIDYGYIRNKILELEQGKEK